MDSVSPRKDVSEDIFFTGSIPELVEDWCRNSEPIEDDIAEVYAINFAATTIGSQPIFDPNEITAI